MANQPLNPATYRFGPYEVDAASGQLRKEARKIRLAGQPLEVLLLLLERPGSVISREEIQARLWSQETFVDFENSLNKAVNKLRQALNDSSDKPVFIETIPRRGYRFIAKVKREEFQSVEVAPAIPPESIPPEIANNAAAIAAPRVDLVFAPSLVFLRQSPYKIFLPIAAVAVLLFLVWFFLRASSVPRVTKVSPLTNSARADMYGRLQTDGVRLFFLQRWGHRWELSQMSTSGGAIQPFPTTFSNSKILAISPDSAELLIAPFESREPILPLWSLSSVGGTPHRLGEIAVADAIFTPDGAQITFSNGEGIFTLDRNGGKPRKLVDLKGEKDRLAWSADGRELRFDWRASTEDAFTIWSVGVDGVKPHQLLPGWSEVPAQCCGRFSRDGSLYSFIGYSSNGQRCLFLRRERGGNFTPPDKPIRLDTGPVFFDDLVFSPDSRKLFALGDVIHSEYVRYDPATRETRGLLAGESSGWLNVSRDMNWSVFRGSDAALWVSKLDGSQRRRLVDNSVSPELPAFRPNSNEIVFLQRPKGSIISKISVISMEGGELRDVVSEPFSVSAPSWSADGTKMFYSAESEHGSDSGIYFLDWQSREKKKLPASAGYWKSRMSPDGKFIASVTADSKQVGLFDLATQKWSILVKGMVIGPVALSGDSQFLYYQDLLEQDQPVRRLNLRTRKAETVFECRPFLEGTVSRCAFEDLLPDGSLLLKLTRGDHDVYSIDLDLR
jgi:DNA-binding winged helix-turn-helix (wHTH) protein/Tol biopolymer transport system component